jgi:hypothetical protein
LLYAAVKATLSGLLVLAVSEASKRSPMWGGLLASLPLVSVLAFIWLWRDTGDAERIAAQAQSTFWFVLPSLPMFLVMPLMLRSGFGFWLALFCSCLLTMVLYSGTAWLLPKMGIQL